MRPSRSWIGLALVWAVFFWWYTSFGSPLTPEEVERYVSFMEERGRPPEDIARVRAFLESDTGDDFVMVNVIEMREPPLRPEGVGPDESAQDVLDRYMEYMWPALLRRACHPVLFGTAAADALDLWGIEGADTWTTVGLMRYRSRRDMMEIAANPAFSGPHEFKIAAMTKTIAFPADPWLQLGDPRLVLGLVFLALGFARQALRRPSDS